MSEATIELPGLWELSSPWHESPIYGNVGGFSDAQPFDPVRDPFPGHLFVPADVRGAEDVEKLLDQWDDFIWSDDDVPWVARKGAERLRSSSLTGFDFETVYIADVGNESLDLPLEQLPRLYRLVVPTEWSKADSLAPTSDFFMALVDGRRLAITQRALDSLVAAGWQNFSAVPLGSS